jgi:hypothetical protein
MLTKTYPQKRRGKMISCPGFDCLISNLIAFAFLFFGGTFSCADAILVDVVLRGDFFWITQFVIHYKLTYIIHCQSLLESVERCCVLHPGEGVVGSSSRYNNTGNWKAAAKEGLAESVGFPFYEKAMTV